MTTTDSSFTYLREALAEPHTRDTASLSNLGDVWKKTTPGPWSFSALSSEVIAPDQTSVCMVLSKRPHGTMDGWFISLAHECLPDLLAAYDAKSAALDAALAREARLREGLRRIGGIADGRDRLDGFPRPNNERQRRLADIAVEARALLTETEQKP